MFKWMEKLGINELNIAINKVDILLAVFTFIVAFIGDVNHNKIIDLGVNHEANVFFGVMIKSITIWYFSITWVVFAAIMFLLLRLFRRVRKGSQIQSALLGVDILFGSLMILSIVPIFAGTILMIYFPDSAHIPFYGSSISLIDLYHIFGVTLLLLSNFYFAVTE